MVKKNSVRPEDNKFAVKLFTNQFSKIEHFIFYGTLLGFIRDGMPIAGDNDVDILVNQNHHEEVKKIVKALGFKIDDTKYPNNTKFFLQADGKIDGHTVRVDFYFYDAQADQDFLLEYWNSHGEPKNYKYVLKIPKALIFPIKEQKFKDIELHTPCHSRVICEYLYGPTWKIPAKRKLDYADVCHGGRLINYKFLRLGKVLDTKEIFGKVIRKLII